jgi:hypothetical protein
MSLTSEEQENDIFTEIVFLNNFHEFGVADIIKLFTALITTNV